MPYWKIYNDSPHFAIEVPWRISERISWKWLNENINGDWCRKGTEYRFREQEDYVLFKLTWLF